MFTMERRVGYSDVCESGCLDPARIADYFQDCGSFHTDAVGVGPRELIRDKGCAWLLAGWQIVVDRYPVYGETLKITTAPYKSDKVFAYRNFAMYDESGARVAVANSFWFLLDVNSGTLSRMREDVAMAFTHEEKLEMEYAPRRVLSTGITEPAEPIRVEKYFVDTNHHMNNAWYIRATQRFLPEGRSVRQVRVEYRQAAAAGSLLYPKLAVSEDMVRILLGDEAGRPYALVEYTLNGAQ